ncbi:hypothetical protein EON63_10925, partial [archaeon]
MISMSFCVDIARCAHTHTYFSLHTDSEHNWFTIMLVPHTQYHTILTHKHTRDVVNIEVDVLGKLVCQRVGGQVQGLE